MQARAQTPLGYGLACSVVCMVETQGRGPSLPRCGLWGIHDQCAAAIAVGACHSTDLDGQEHKFEVVCAPTRNRDVVVIDVRHSHRGVGVRDSTGHVRGEDVRGCLQVELQDRHEGETFMTTVS